MDSIFSQLMQSLITATKTIFPDNKVIRAQQGGAEPSNPYVSIRVIRDEQVGRNYVDTLLSEDSEITTTVNYETLVQFSFLSKDSDVAGDMAKQFIQYLNTPVTLRNFRINKLSKISVTPIRNVASLRDGEWVEHYNVDVLFNYASRTVQSFQPIEVVEMLDELSGEVFTVPPEVVIL